MTGPFDMHDPGTPGLTCDQLDERLPDYLDGAAGPAGAAAVERHLTGCERCAALVAELGDVRAQAAALPVLTPPRDLWVGISARIAAPVLPLDVRSADGPSRTGRHRAARPWSRAWLGAAAAALVVVTAGITHQLTARGRATAVASVDASRPTVTDGAPAAAGAPATTVAQGAADSGTAFVSPPPAPPAGSAGRRATVAARAGAPAGVRAVRRSVAEQTYGREIVSLREILRQRRASLNPATVEVLELNLKIIDEAIAQSRAALATDPASEFLDRQLDMALEKKLELLRTAALLPAT